LAIRHATHLQVATQTQFCFIGAGGRMLETTLVGLNTVDASSHDFFQQSIG
jgi:hypothetical protein